MPKSLSLPAILLAGLAFASHASASDVMSGKQLHDQNCMKCHTTELYTSEERKIDSLARLRARVQTCATNLELDWFEEDIDAVTDYLNEEYYKF